MKSFDFNSTPLQDYDNGWVKIIELTIGEYPQAYHRNMNNIVFDVFWTNSYMKHRTERYSVTFDSNSVISIQQLGIEDVKKHLNGYIGYNIVNNKVNIYIKYIERYTDVRVNIIGSTLDNYPVLCPNEKAVEESEIENFTIVTNSLPPIKSKDGHGWYSTNNAITVTVKKSIHVFSTIWFKVADDSDTEVFITVVNGKVNVIGNGSGHISYINNQDETTTVYIFCEWYTNFYYRIFSEEEIIYKQISSSEVPSTFDGTIYFNPIAGGTRPQSPKNGDMFFNTTLNKAIWWNGTTWVDATGTPV